MRYIESDGTLFKLTEKKYIKYLNAVRESPVDLSVYIDDFGTFVCAAPLNVTDITADDAQYELDHIDTKFSSDS